MSSKLNLGYSHLLDLKLISWLIFNHETFLVTVTSIFDILDGWTRFSGAKEGII